MNMRMLFSLLLAFLCLYSCSADINNGDSTSVDKVTSSNVSEQSDSVQNELSSIDILYKQGENYEILSDKSLYNFHYYIRDNDGYIIDEGYHGPRGSFGIVQEGDFIALDYGYGGNAWAERYYDVSSGRVSRFFERPVARNDELVAYFNVKEIDGELGIILIVQNMFDPNTYYMEIQRDFSDFVIKDIAKAQFLENNKKLEITYWITPDDKEVTEIIDLR